MVSTTVVFALMLVVIGIGFLIGCLFNMSDRLKMSKEIIELNQSVQYLFSILPTEKQLEITELSKQIINERKFEGKA